MRFIDDHHREVLDHWVGGPHEEVELFRCGDKHVRETVQKQVFGRVEVNDRDRLLNRVTEWFKVASQLIGDLIDEYSRRHNVRDAPLLVQ